MADKKKCFYTKCMQPSMSEYILCYMHNHPCCNCGVYVTEYIFTRRIWCKHCYELRLTSKLGDIKEVFANLCDIKPIFYQHLYTYGLTDDKTTLTIDSDTNINIGTYLDKLYASLISIDEYRVVYPYLKNLYATVVAYNELHGELKDISQYIQIRMTDPVALQWNKE